MSDLKPEDLPPTGDASHLLDNEPVPVPTVEKTVVPVSMEAQPGSAQGMRARIHSILTSADQIAIAKASAESCGSCASFRWPEPGSRHWHKIRATCAAARSQLPSWMRNDVEPYGGPPELFGNCIEIIGPVTKEPAMVDCRRPGCELWRPDRAAAGLHVAPDARRSR